MLDLNATHENAYGWKKSNQNSISVARTRPLSTSTDLAHRPATELRPYISVTLTPIEPIFHRLIDRLKNYGEFFIRFILPLTRFAPETPERK